MRVWFEEVLNTYVIKKHLNLYRRVFRCLKSWRWLEVSLCSDWNFWYGFITDKRVISLFVCDKAKKCPIFIRLSHSLFKSTRLFLIIFIHKRTLKDFWTWFYSLLTGRFNCFWWWLHTVQNRFWTMGRKEMVLISFDWHSVFDNVYNTLLAFEAHISYQFFVIHN